jgi:hypothetical protein
LGRFAVDLRQSVKSLILIAVSRLGAAADKSAAKPGRFLLRCHIGLTYSPS